MSAFVRGRQNDRETNLASPLGKTLLKGKRDRGEKKGAFAVRYSASHNALSIQISTLVSQTAISDFQCCYKKGPFLSWNVCSLLCVYVCLQATAESLFIGTYNGCTYGPFPSLRLTSTLNNRSIWKWVILFLFFFVFFLENKYKNESNNMRRCIHLSSVIFFQFCIV